MSRKTTARAPVKRVNLNTKNGSRLKAAENGGAGRSGREVNGEVPGMLGVYQPVGDPQIMPPSAWFRKKFPLLEPEYGDAVREETEKKSGALVVANDLNLDFLAATLGKRRLPGRAGRLLAH